MSMTNRGAVALGGSRAQIDPFVDNGRRNRITISIDNEYNRGRIPAFSLWAPSNYGSKPYLYMPYMPPINIRASDDTTNYDIEDEWHDYFRGGDEVIALDISTLIAASPNLKFFGKQGTSNDTDLTAVALGSDTATITSVGAKGSGGDGLTRLTMADMLDTDTKPAEGLIGTGDILVLAGSDTSTAIKAYQQAQRVVIMDQPFDFLDSLSGVAGEGGLLTESAVRTYDGRIDDTYINYFDALNTDDSSPALTVATRFTNGSRFDFETIYRG